MKKITITKKVLLLIGMIAASQMLLSYEVNAIENNVDIQKLAFEHISNDYNTYLLEQQKIVIDGIVEEPTVEESVNKQINRWDIILTDEEINLLASIVFLEARGESSEGQIAVTEVILNRMIFEKEFKGTLTEVLSQKNQFSSWKNRSIATPSGKEFESVFKVLYGNSNILTKDYVFFSTFPRNNKGTIKIGNHYFCKY